MTHDMEISLAVLDQARIIGVTSDKLKAEKFAQQFMVGLVAKRFGVDPSKVCVSAGEIDKKKFRIPVTFSWPDKPRTSQIESGSRVERSVLYRQANGEIIGMWEAGTAKSVEPVHRTAVVLWDTGQWESCRMTDLRLIHQ